MEIRLVRVSSAHKNHDNNNRLNVKCLFIMKSGIEDQMTVSL
jgi:hypothetical protein